MKAPIDVPDDPTPTTHTPPHQFLYKLSFTAHDLSACDVDPSPCLVCAVLDGVEEVGEGLRQHGAHQGAAKFSGNAAAVLGRLRAQGADGAALWRTTVWTLLRSPHLFAPYAHPLRLSHLLCAVRLLGRF